MIAVQRRQPTRSPSNGTHSSATRKGVAKISDSASSSCSQRSANKLRPVENSSSAERPTWSQGRVVRIRPGRLTGLTKTNVSAKAKK